MPTINIHGGSGGGSGGSGGGGSDGGIPPKPPRGAQTSLRRLFDNYINNPNPATEQIFSEALNNIFPGASVLGGNSKKLTTYINKLQKTIEKRATQHASQASRLGWDTSVSTHSRMLAQKTAIERAQGIFHGVIGRPISRISEAANSASSFALGALGSIGTSQQVSMIRALGSRGQGFAFSGNRRELKKIERTLEKSERNSTQLLAAIKTGKGVTLSPDQAAQQAHHRRIVQAVQAQRATIAQARLVAPRHPSKTGFGALGDAAAGYMAASAPYLALAGAAIGAPVLAARGISAAWSLARPYTDVRRGLARRGRYAGFNSRALYNAIHPGVITPPGWMQRSGITASDVPGLLTAYGAGTGDTGQTLGILHAIAAGKTMSGLGGFSAGNIAGFLGQKRIMGIGGGNKAYEAQAARLLTYAVSKGMDGATVLSDIKRGISSIASAGGIQRPNQMERFLGRIYSSGSPLARSGGAKSIIGTLNSMSVKTPTSALMFLQAEQAYGGVKTMAEAKQMLGRLPTNKAQLAQIQLGVRANRGGDPYAGERVLYSVLTPSEKLKFAQRFVKRQYGNSPYGILAESSLTGLSIPQIMAATTGGNAALRKNISASGANTPSNIWSVMTKVSASLISSGHYVKYFGDSVNKFGDWVDRLSESGNMHAHRGQYGAFTYYDHDSSKNAHTFYFNNPVNH